MKPRLKTLLKGLVAAGLLLVLLGALEGVLRWTGVGADEHTVFKPLADQDGYQVLNAAYVQRYFNKDFQPSLAFTPFRTDKTPGSFRVVVLGGSVVAGFPYPFYLGFPARLQQRLEAYAVGQPIEVINLGIANANSYALWDLKEAVVAQAPDAVILYTGHNEYYGAFGVGSSINTLGQAVWMKRLVLRLKRLVLYRTLARLFSSEPPGSDLPASRMLSTIDDTDIPFGGKVYQAGIAQFETNIGEVLRTFQESGLAVYGGLLVSDLKSQRPVGEGAMADYERAEELLAQGDTLEARAAFVWAKDRDQVRFRAPEALNEVLSRWAQEGLLTLVDLQPLAVAPSLDGVEDEMFFLDHIHPDHNGYDAIADAFFEVIKTHPVLEGQGFHRFSEAPIQPIAYERAYANLQISSMRTGPVGPGPEKAIILRSMLGIYLSSRNYLDSLIVRTFMDGLSVEAALQAALPIARSQGDTLRALLLHRSLLHWRPFDEQAIREAVAFAEAAADTSLLPLSEEIMAHAINLRAEAAFLNKLAWVKLKERLPEDAARLIAMAEALDPNAEGLPLIKAQVRAAQQALTTQ